MNSTHNTIAQPNSQPTTHASPNSQPCPQCGFPIGVVAGTKEAICTNCGYKDPCCD